MVQFIATFKMSWLFFLVALITSILLIHQSYCKLQGITNVHAKEFSQKTHPLLEFSFFPWPLLNNISFENSQFNAIGMEHDLRLLPALWLHLIRRSCEDRNSTEITIPFQWNSLLNLLPDTKALELHNVDLVNSSHEINCAHRSKHAITTLSPVETALSEPERVSISTNFLLNLYDFQPRRIVCLGLVDNSILQFRLEVDKTKFAKSVLEQLVDSYQKLSPYSDRISVSEEIRMTREALKKDPTSNPSNLLFNSGQQQLISQLDFSFPYGVSDLLHTVTKSQSVNTSSRLDHRDRILLNNCLIAMKSPTKYFHEAHLLNTTAGFHFDWRFFKKATYDAYEHKIILHRLARAWLQFCETANLTTWLAHGSLLGWYWNGLNFPWDEDIDVQMTAASLYLLAKHFNQSIVVDYCNHEKDTTTHQYFIDVNPHFMNVLDGDSANLIDARFIDLHTGMYVDITALTITTEELLNDKKASLAMHSLINPSYSEVAKSASVNPQYLKQIHEQLKIQEIDALSEQQIVNCKNKHFYYRSNIFPLTKSSFEGVKANVPINFKLILKNEYPNGLLHKHYLNWSFRPYLGIWLPDEVCKGDHYGKECEDEDAVLESNLTKDLRLKRGQPLRKESRIRYDPFIIERNNQLLQMEQN